MTMLSTPTWRCYLGRLCKHRECPSLRRCAARHCGRRPHLKDELDDITLEPTLIATPPLVLWAVVVAQAVVPADVGHIMLAALNN